MRRIEKLAWIRKLLLKKKRVHFNDLKSIQNWSMATCYRLADDMVLLYEDVIYEEYTIILVKTKKIKKKFNIDDYNSILIR